MIQAKSIGIRVNRVNQSLIVQTSSDEEDKELNLERETNASENQTTNSTSSVDSDESHSNNDDHCDENIKNFDDDNDDDNYRDDNTSISSSLSNDDSEMNTSENDNDKIKKKNKQEEFKNQEETVEQQKEDELTEEETNRKQKVMKKKKQEKSEYKRMLTNGVQKKKLKSGTGKIARMGKHVTIYYLACAQIGCCKIKFEECLKGNGFRFKLGSGYMLRDVNVGIVGMKVGEKRRLTIPPKMGYV